MKILDCTLRDGANIVGKGFSAELTTLMLDGLIEAGIRTIEFGNCMGIGAYKNNNAIAPLTDLEYLELSKPYLGKAELGMFMLAGNGTKENVMLAAEGGLNFIRVGANAGDGKVACEVVKTVKDAGLTCYYSAMKGYILPPCDLAAEASLLADYGLDGFTIMDSAGTMLPSDVTAYITALNESVSIPVGFHGHNNLGLSVANALAAYSAGATTLDVGLMGMARSAGNCATEELVAVLQRMGLAKEIDLYKLLYFIDELLAPAMKQYDYRAPVCPKDLVFGVSGCHSSFESMLRAVASEYDVPLYPLIVNVSRQDRKAPSRALAEQVAASMKQ